MFAIAEGRAILTFLKQLNECFNKRLGILFDRAKCLEHSRSYSSIIGSIVRLYILFSDRSYLIPKIKGVLDCCCLI